MSQNGIHPALTALHWAFERLQPRPEAPLLFLGARPGPWTRQQLAAWNCVQDSRPFADALEAAGADPKTRISGGPFQTTLLLPPRQRDARRAQLALALEHTRPGGQLLTAAANTEGSRSLLDDLALLVPNLQREAKHKCRIAIATRPQQLAGNERLQHWLDDARLRQIEHPDGSFWSAPGLFAWDRTDPGSALLAASLPHTLSGRVADLGSGWGFLSRQILQHCPDVQELELFEASAIAVEAAQRNLAGAAPARIRIHWHDVCRGLPGRFDHIVSNPPFHVDRADHPELARAFIRQAAAALQPAGTLWLVGKRHLPFEDLLRQHFQQWQIRAQDHGYKVLEARLPRP